MRSLCITAVAACLLCGCGQKGPLILPDSRAHTAIPAKPAAPASTAPRRPAVAPPNR